MQTYGHPGSHYGPVPPQNPPPNGYNLATQAHQQQAATQQSSSSAMPSQHPQPNPESPDNRDGPVSSSDKNTSTQTESQQPPRQSQSSITSPAASPYPSTSCSVTGMYHIILFFFFNFLFKVYILTCNRLTQCQLNLATVSEY